MSNQRNLERLETSGRRRHSETDITSPGGLLHSSTDGIPVSLPGSLRQESKTQEQASELQLRWNEGIAENIGFSDSYDQVAVLIIKWRDDLDQLNTKNEVAELEEVFKDDFNYCTRKIELHTDTSPQQQLNFEMARFVLEFDGPRSLLIVYYTGHSKYRKVSARSTSAESGLLEFFAETPPRSPDTPGFTVGKGKEAAQAQWHQAEKSLLEGLKADALAILDTCFAAHAHKSAMEGNRTYQLLAACGHDMVTSGPGKNSFTAALIKALRDLRNLGRPFSTWRLCERINMHPPRHNSPSYVYDRLQQNERYIRLSPLDSSEIEKKQRSKRLANEQQSASFLTLRFAFGESCRKLTDTHIDALTKYLPDACKRAGMDLHGIELRDFKLQRNASLRRSMKAVLAASRFQMAGRSRGDTSQYNEALEVLDEAPSAKEGTMQRLPFSGRPSINIETSDASIRSQNTFINPTCLDAEGRGGYPYASARPNPLHLKGPRATYRRVLILDYMAVLIIVVVSIASLAMLVTHKDSLFARWTCRFP